MGEFINDYAFYRPDAILRARGRQEGQHFVLPDGSDDWGNNGGMYSPAETILPRDSRIVRFSGMTEKVRKPSERPKGPSGSPLPHLAAAGGWWLTFEQYKVIEAYAQQTGASISRAISILCCVPPEWNDATVVLQATVMRPLLAYTGFGRTAQGKGGVLNGHNPHGRRVRQLFIPGLGNPDVRREAILIEGSGFLPLG